MNKEQLIKELAFKASRSSGSGGQNVNKVSTKVELRFNIDKSLELNKDEKDRIKLKLKNYERKYYHLKFEPEKLREVMLKLTEKINELSDELDIVGEMFTNSLKFKE